jgi:hypothetical protein
MEWAGKKLAEIRDWLREQHGIKVDRATVCRTLAKIRKAAPPPPPVDLGLMAEPEPANDEDELGRLRKYFRRQAFDKTVAPRDQQGAARLVVAVMKEQRERQRPQQPAGAGAQPPEPAWTPPTFGVKPN